MTRVSVVVCTYSRSQLLAKAIRTFAKQTLAPELYEILVVDNNSTDDTRDVVHALMEETSVRLRYCLEPEQGLHNARNRGILAARGDIVLFGDEDIEACEAWVETVLAEFDANPRAGLVGGRVLPNWVEEPPDWIFDFGTREIHPVFAYLDRGEERLVVDDGWLFGCNFAIRRDLAIRIGGSPPDAFPANQRHLSGRGETAMIKHVQSLGHETVYLPQALVRHRADPSRMSPDYIVDRYERWAIEEVYGIFRKTDSTLTATARAIRAAAHGGLASFRSGHDKVRPRLFRRAQRRHALRVLKQTLRVLASRDLRSFIRKKTYLDEIGPVE